MTELENQTKERDVSDKIFFTEKGALEDDEKAKLEAIGYVVIETNNRDGITQGVPIVPIILPSDVISKCMVGAVNYYKPSRDKFGELLLIEIQKTSAK